MTLTSTLHSLLKWDIAESESFSPLNIHLPSQIFEITHCNQKKKKEIKKKNYEDEARTEKYYYLMMHTELYMAIKTSNSLLPKKCTKRKGPCGS